MSYFSRFSFDSNFVHGGSPSTPLLHDILAIQAIYGANMNTRTGDSIYGFGSNNARSIDGFTFDPYDFASNNSIGFAIWDAGGIDTIDASQFDPPDGSRLAQIIDLREGAFSSIGFSFLSNGNGDGGLSDAFEPLKNNIAIAYGAVIENAIAGDGDDHIFGNDAGNRLVGNSGDDQILGFGGRDTLEGGAGDDELFGGDDNDTLDGGAHEDKLFGDGGDDVLIGGDQDDELSGGSGQDTLRGGGGNDVQRGGTGNDIFEGGSGDDAHFGGEGRDTVTYEFATSAIRLDPFTFSNGFVTGDTFDSIEAYRLTPFVDTFYATEGDEDIYTISGGDTVFALGGNDNVYGAAGRDTIDGGDGNDYLDGAQDNDTLVGGAGDDQLFGGTGADTMTGGSGSDTFYVDNTADIVSERLADVGTDHVLSSVSFTLTTGVENLTLLGSAALSGTGTARSNVITGNSAANTLDGGIGTDTLVGRGGNDTYVVDNVGDIVDESSGGIADVDTVRSSITFNLSNSTAVRGIVENLTLIGTGAINGTGNSRANVITGNNASNTLLGHGDNDTLDGGGGADTLFGGTGNDTYIVDNASDRVDETTGGSTDVDTVLSSVSFSLLNPSQTLGLVENITLTGSGNINATGNGLNNILTGNKAANTLDGGALHDTLVGAEGNDRLFGGSGNDIYFYSTPFDNDTITDSSGSDRLQLLNTSITNAAREGNDLFLTLTNGTIRIVNHFTTGTVEAFQSFGLTITMATGTIGGDAPGMIAGSERNDTLDGRGGDDILYGNKGDDHLIGWTGNDLLDGGRGRDVVDGGVGDDRLTGGAGRDTFVFARGYGHDTITDFHILEDRLDISRFGRRPEIDFSRNGLDLDFGGGDVLSIEVDIGQAFAFNLLKHVYERGLTPFLDMD